MEVKEIYKCPKELGIQTSSNAVQLQVVDRGYSVLEVSKRLGVTSKSLYDWVQRFYKPDKNKAEDAKLEVENRRLKADMARVTEERDILNLEGSK